MGCDKEPHHHVMFCTHQISELVLGPLLNAQIQNGSSKICGIQALENLEYNLF